MNTPGIQKFGDISDFLGAPSKIWGPSPQFGDCWQLCGLPVCAFQCPVLNNYSGVVHCFHADDENWITRPTTGEPPPGFDAAACAVVLFSMYIFA